MSQPSLQVALVDLGEQVGKDRPRNARIGAIDHGRDLGEALLLVGAELGLEIELLVDGLHDRHRFGVVAAIVLLSSIIRQPRWRI